MTSNFKKIASSVIILFLLLTCHSVCYSQPISRIVNYNAEYQRGDKIKKEYAFPKDIDDPDKYFQIVFTFELTPEQIEADIAGTMIFDQENGTIQIRGKDGNLQSKGGLTLNGVAKIAFVIEEIPYATLNPQLLIAIFTINQLVDFSLPVKGEATFLDASTASSLSSKLASKLLPIGSLKIAPDLTWDEPKPFSTLLLDDDATVEGGIRKLVRAELTAIDVAQLIVAALTAIPPAVSKPVGTVIELGIGNAAISANLGFLSTATLSGESITVNGANITRENQTIKAPGLDLTQNSYTVNSIYNEKFTYKAELVASSDVTLEFNPLGIPIWNYEKVIGKLPIVPIVPEKEVDLNFTSNQTTFPITQTSTVPTVKAPVPQGTIPEQGLTDGGSSKTVNVASYFSSENTLSYRVSTTPSGIVSASVSGSRVTIRPRAAGGATVTVTARDTTDTSLTAVQTIAVVVRQTGSPIVPSNPDPTFTPPSSSNPRAEGLREGVSVIIQNVPLTGPGLNLRSDPWIGNNQIRRLWDGATGIITDGPEENDDYTWWKIEWDQVDIEAWSVEAFGGSQLLFRRPPDLEIRSFDVSPSTVGTGEEIELKVRIRNNGPGESAETNVLFYYSENRDDDLDDFLKNKGKRDAATPPTLSVPSLRDGRSSRTLTKTVDAPMTPGRYYYGAILAPNVHDTDYIKDLTTDYLENDFARGERVDVISPDYIVESISVSPTTLAPGQSFTLRATVRNQGIGEPTRSAILRYYRSSDARISTSDTRVGSDSVRVLDTDETGRESIPLTAPSTPGVYYYGARVSSVTNESRTDNNWSAAKAITVRASEPDEPAVPDLVVDTPTTRTTTLGPGESLTLTATVRNKGTATSPATTFRWYRSPNSSISANDTDIGDNNVISLRAGATDTQQIILTTPAAVGTYYYGGCVESSTDESDTTNNCSDAITITVQNRAPTTVGTILGPTLTVGDTPVRLDVSTYFSDPNNTSLTYTASSSDTNVVSAEAAGVSGSNLTLSPIAEGNATITVTASDGELTATQTLSVTVNPMPVTISESPDLVVSLTATENLVTPNGYFKLQATVRNQGNADTSGVITLRYFVSSDATISTDDVEIGTDSVGSLKSNLSEDEDHGLRASLNPGVYYYYACVDSVTGEENTGNNCSNVLAITVRGPDLIVDSVSVDLLGQTGGINPNGNFKLNATVKNQGTGTAGATTLRYYVSSDNVFSSDDTEVETVTLNSLGAGNSSNQLSNTIQSSYISGVFYCFVCADSLTDEVNTNNNCSEPIQITVRNVAPVAKGTIAAQTLNVGTPASIDISQSFTDQNNDTLTYSASSSDNNVATATVIQSQVTITPRRNGSARITVTANDSEFSATQTISVTVADPNRAPVAIGTIASRTLKAGDTSEQIDVASNFQDADGDTLIYAATSNNTSVVTVSVSGSQLAITPAGIGSTTITVTASDGEFTATQTIAVTVTTRLVANSAPITVGAISSQTLTFGDSSIQLDVATAFQDPDNDTLTYTVRSTNLRVVTTSVSGSQVTITPVRSGSATITVTASDGELTATQTISVTVTVTTLNHAPEAVGTIFARTLTVGDSPLVIDVSGDFQDPDGDDLTYNTSSNNTSVATASVSNAQVTIAPVAVGSATITVTASDGELTATQTIALTITDTSSISIIPDPNLATALRETLGLGANDDITLANIQRLTSLEAENKRITNLAGLEYATSLKTLVLSNNQISNISPLSGLKHLTLLSVWNNKISDVSALAALTNLKTLYLSRNTISDVSALAALTNLNFLSLHGNTISDVSALAALTNLNDLSLYNNQISDVSPLTSLTNLETLQLNNNRITALPAGLFYGFSNLRLLHLSPNPGGPFTLTLELARTDNTNLISPGPATVKVKIAEGAPFAMNVNLSVYGGTLSATTATIPKGSTESDAITVTQTGTGVTTVSLGTAPSLPSVNYKGIQTAVGDSLILFNDEGENNSPFVVSGISTQTLFIGDSNATVNISDYFRDSDGDTLTYTASSNNTTVATVSISGSIVTITPKTAGSVTVTVTASDGSLTATLKFTVDVLSSIILDENLAVVVREALGLGADDDITYVNILGLTSLRANRHNASPGAITDLTGLENATNLTWLILDRNAISDLSPLAALTNLTLLQLIDNDISISDVTPLKNLTKLTSLNLGNNEISDISPLAALTNLTSLSLASNEISDISSLKNLTKLTSLSLDNNEISDFSPLAALTNLTFLHLAYTGISDVTPLKNLTKLTRAYLHDNDISNVTPLKGLTNLTDFLHLYNNDISDVTPLKGLTNLKSLLLYNNQISDVSPLASLTNLTSLSLNSNVISDISSLKAITNLTGLTVSDNQIADLPAGMFKSFSSLTTLWLDGNPGAPFTLTLELERTDNTDLSAVSPATVKVKLAEGAPFAMSVSLSVTDGTLSTTTATIAKGSTESSTTTVTQTGNGATTVSLGAAPRLPSSNYKGIQTAVGDSLVLFSDARAPIAVGTIPAQTLTTGGTATTVNVSNYFRDPNGDTLTYTASSNNTASTTTSVSGITLTITPVAAGSATITVTASDGSLTTSQTISVTVKSAPIANRAPAAVGTISAQTLTVGTSEQIDVSSNFSDPDNDTLTYTASSSATSVATVSVSGSQVTITPVAAGSATITVTASDGTLTATQTIAVTVTAAPVANRAPVTVETISAQTLTVGTSVQIDVSSNFSDPDNDTLTYTASSSATSVATVSVSSSQVTITPVAAGSATITVTANDGSLTTTQTISVTVNAAVIDPPIRERTQQVRDAIVAAVPDVDSADDVTAAQLAKITSLSMGGLEITSLKSGDFDGLTSLTGLYMNNTSISDISELSKLTSLTSLNLERNSISDISALSDLTSLTALDLDNNSISDISVLSKLTSLTHLGLNYNSISDISVLSKLTSLTQLPLAANSISDVTPLENLTSLTVLILEGNPITDYAPLHKLKKANPNMGIQIDLTNNLPVFTEGDSTTRTVAENTASGVNIGNAISATDADNHTLTYSLSGTDAESFSIVSTSGQLQTSAALDYETKTSYSVIVTVYDGNSGGDTISVTINVTDVANAAPPTQTSPAIPDNTALLSNYPNPFNPETWIPYQLAKPAEVTLTIYDMRGVVVRQLTLGHRAAGVYHSRNRAAHWDGRNTIGEKVATGVYFVKFSAGDYTATRKMLIRK